jgi:hypothetical protein
MHFDLHEGRPKATGPETIFGPVYVYIPHCEVNPVAPVVPMAFLINKGPPGTNRELDEGKTGVLTQHDADN